jgi:hypothetical protein
MLAYAILHALMALMVLDQSVGKYAQLASTNVELSVLILQMDVLNQFNL